MEVLVALCVAAIAYILISHVLMYLVRRLTGVKQGRDGAFFAREAQDYLWGKLA